MSSTEHYDPSGPSEVTLRRVEDDEDDEDRWMLWADAPGQYLTAPSETFADVEQ